MPCGRLRTSGCWPSGDVSNPAAAGRSGAILALLASGREARAATSDDGIWFELTETCSASVVVRTRQAADDLAQLRMLDRSCRLLGSQPFDLTFLLLRPFLVLAVHLERKNEH